MKIIVNKETKIVKYLLENNSYALLKEILFLKQHKDPLCSSTTHSIIENVRPPRLFASNALKYDNGAWSIANQELYDVALSFEKEKKKHQLKEKMPTRPRVPLTLESGTQIEIDGGRADKDNFKEGSGRLIRKSITDTFIIDANGDRHPATQTDVFNGYTAIVDNFAELMQWKWAKEAEIEACETIEALEAVEI